MPAASFRSIPVASAARCIALSALTLAAACGGGDAPQAKSPPQALSSASAHSIDRAAMDPNVRPGNDFFLYANGSWYATTQIPPDRADTGVWRRLAQEIEQRNHDLLEQAAKAPAGAGERKIGDYYASYLDEAGIEARGIAPLGHLLTRVSAIGDAHALASYLGASIRADVDAMNATQFHTDHVLGLWVERDWNEPAHNAPYLLQGGLGMPDRSYYLEDTPRMQAVRTAYLRHLTAILRLAGVSDPEAKAGRALALEKKIAETHTSRTDSADVSKANNPWSRADFAVRAKGMDWNAFFAAADLDRPARFIVWHPRALTGLAALVASEPLDVWKDYLTARAIDHVARFLPKAFNDEAFAFYEKELRGSEVAPPRWRTAVDVTSAALGEAVGKVYVSHYFPPETKRAIASLVQNISKAFDHRIDGLAWMSPATKAKAKEKLTTLKIGLGYPDNWRDDSGLLVVRGDALGNLERAEAFEYRRNVQKLGQPVDPGEWVTTPQVVNAYNLPVRNALNFPAGLLAPPLFDPQATAAANYGAIGALIGHEISHSFDDQGAKFDAHGKLTNWWTADDLAHFEASAAALAAQFDTYKPFPDLAVNGKLTLSENIADLGGIAAAYDAWHASLAGQPAPVAQGLSGEQQFFLSFAQGWRTKMREQRERVLIATNEHAPPRYRTLTVRNFDAWYLAFDVTPADALYLAPSARVRIW